MNVVTAGTHKCMTSADADVEMKPVIVRRATQMEQGFLNNARWVVEKCPGGCSHAVAVIQSAYLPPRISGHISEANPGLGQCSYGGISIDLPKDIKLG